MEPGSSAVVTCPRCRAANTYGSTQCFLCDGSLVGVRPEPSTWTSAKPPAAPASFHLATMMLVIALIAVGLGVAIAMPPLAVILTLPTIIALCRTVSLPKRTPGGNPSSLRYVGSFLATFVVVCLVMASSVAAFFATCLGVVSLKPGDYGGEWVNAGLLLGAIAGIAVPVVITVAISRWRGTRYRTGPPTGRRD